MSDIFISYKSGDRERVQPLAELLAKQGWTVWLDTEIHAGTQFDEAIEEALNSTRCVVVVWSKASVKSRWVKNEARAGLRRGILVPVMIDEVEIPLEFSSLQTIDLINWPDTRDDRSLYRLLNSIDSILDVPSLPTLARAEAKVEVAARAEASPPLGEAETRGGQTFIIKGVLVGLAVLLAALFAFAAYKYKVAWVARPGSDNVNAQASPEKSPESKIEVSEGASVPNSNQPGTNQAASNRETPIVVKQDNGAPSITASKPLASEQGSVDVATELRSKGLIPVLQQARAYAKSGTSENKEKARELYSSVVNRLSAGGRSQLDQQALGLAANAQDIDVVIRNYRRVFDKYF